MLQDLTDSPLQSIRGQVIRVQSNEVRTWAAMPKGLNDKLVTQLVEYNRLTNRLVGWQFAKFARTAANSGLNEVESWANYDQQVVDVWASLSRYVLLRREVMPLGNLLASGTEWHHPKVEEYLDRPGMAIFAVLDGVVYHVTSRQRWQQFRFNRSERSSRALFYIMGESEAHLLLN